MIVRYTNNIVETLYKASLHFQSIPQLSNARLFIPSSLMAQTTTNIILKKP